MKATLIYGPKATGKTELAQRLASKARKDGGFPLIVDMEHRDFNTLPKCGKRITHLYVTALMRPLPEVMALFDATIENGRAA